MAVSATTISTDLLVMDNGPEPEVSSFSLTVPLNG